MAVEYNKTLNFQFSTKCTVIILILVTIYFIASLSISLVCRLLLKAYYASAHQMSLAVVVCSFVIVHHIGRLRYFLRLSTRAYCILQTILNVIFLIIFTITAISSTYLTCLSVHTNYDNVAATVTAYINVLCLLYLTVLCILGLKTYIREHTFQSEKYTLENTNTFELHSRSKDNLVTNRLPKSSGVWKPICCIIYPFYLLLMLILLLIFALTAYNTTGIIYDIQTYRNNSEMVEVKVEGYQPLSLYVHCEGDGNETVVMENGLGGLYGMMWHFIPRLLVNKSFRVCAYDRRGYGWSETFENGDPLHAIELKQRASNNVHFLNALVKAKNISTPFYYAGHSYGAYHLTHMALLYPENVKGLIYLDGSNFSPLKQLFMMMELVANVQYTGLLRAGMDSGLLNYRELYKAIVDFKSLPEYLEHFSVANFKSGYFFASFLREKNPLVDSELAYRELAEELEKMEKPIDVPVLVIDAGSRYPDWFPSQHFSKYNWKYHRSVAGATHESLVMSDRFAPKVAGLIESFINDQDSGE